MIFIWRGYGFLVPLITIVVVGVMSVLFGAIFKTTQPYGVAIGALAAAAALWFAGNSFNSPAKDRIMIDKLTGQEFILKPSHSFFFIKMQYWAYIVGVIGVFLLIALLASNK
jgi:hypothetical protein